MHSLFECIFLKDKDACLYWIPIDLNKLTHLDSFTVFVIPGVILPTEGSSNLAILSASGNFTEFSNLCLERINDGML